MVRGVSPVDMGVTFATGVRPVPPSIMDSKLRPRRPEEGVSMATPKSLTLECRGSMRDGTAKLVGRGGLEVGIETDFIC